MKIAEINFRDLKDLYAVTDINFTNSNRSYITTRREAPCQALGS